MKKFRLPRKTKKKFIKRTSRTNYLGLKYLEELPELKRIPLKIIAKDGKAISETVLRKTRLLKQKL